MKTLERTFETLPSPWVVMSVGIPGSGKTTVLKEMASKLGVERISKDEIRLEIGTDPEESETDLSLRVLAESDRRIARSLSLGASLILDATHWRRRNRIELIEQYRGVGARCLVAVVFETPFATALLRDARRERPVGEEVITRMYDRLRTEPVDRAEGFDLIIPSTEIDIEEY